MENHPEPLKAARELSAHDKGKDPLPLLHSTSDNQQTTSGWCSFKSSASTTGKDQELDVLLSFSLAVGGKLLVLQFHVSLDRCTRAVVRLGYIARCNAVLDRM